MINKLKHLIKLYRFKFIEFKFRYYWTIKKRWFYTRLIAYCVLFIVALIAHIIAVQHSNILISVLCLMLSGISGWLIGGMLIEMHKHNHIIDTYNCRRLF